MRRLPAKGVHDNTRGTIEKILKLSIVITSHTANLAYNSFPLSAL